MVVRTWSEAWACSVAPEATSPTALAAPRAPWEDWLEAAESCSEAERTDWVELAVPSSTVVGLIWAHGETGLLL